MASGTAPPGPLLGDCLPPPLPAAAAADTPTAMPAAKAGAEQSHPASCRALASPGTTGAPIVGDAGKLMTCGAICPRGHTAAWQRAWRRSTAPVRHRPSSTLPERYRGEPRGPALGTGGLTAAGREGLSAEAPAPEGAASLSSTRDEQPAASCGSDQSDGDCLRPGAAGLEGPRLRLPCPHRAFGFAAARAASDAEELAISMACLAFLPESA